MNPDDDLIASEISDQLDGPPPSTDEGVERGDAPAPDAPPPSIRESLAKAMQPDAQADGRPRRADGTFAPKNTPVEAAGKGAATPGAPGGSTPPTADAKPESQAQSNAPAGPPPGWSKESKALFSQLPPSIQADVLKREQEVNAGFQQYAGLKQRNDDFERAIAPNRHIYAEAGVSDAQAIANIWGWFHAIKDSPGEAFPALAQMVGFDLSTVGYTAADGVQQAPEYDPRLVNALSNIDQRVSQFEEWRTQQQRTALDSQINAWSKDKPHFPAVKQDMGRLMQAGITPMGDLDAAYAKATALHGLSVAPAASPAAPAIPPAARAVQARHAAVSPRPTGPNGSGSRPRPDRSIRESLQEALNGAG